VHQRAWRHPRETLEIFGHGAVLDALEREWRAGMLHHGLMLAGPKGIGKATFAYALARRLLTGLDGLAADDPDNRIVRQIRAGSHPDLLALDADEGETVNRLIPVDDVRRLVAFFGKTAASSVAGGGCRVGIIDRADDLNTASANALLKILEEPPRRSILILVCEAPGRLPATVRSRCRQVSLDPLEESDLARAVCAAGGRLAERIEGELEAWVAGSALRALMLGDKSVADALREAGALLAALPGIDQARLGRLAQRLGARDNRDAYNAAFDLMSLHMAQRARAAAFSGAASPHAANWANAIGRVEETKSQADALNLDRSRTLLAAFHRLALELRAAH